MLDYEKIYEDTLQHPIVNKTLEIAINAHKGQMRWDKTPYINHPIWVSKEAMRLALESGWDKDNLGVVAITGLAHDLAEDTPIDEKTLIQHLKLYIPSPYENLILVNSLGMISKSLCLLNKNNHKSYLDFTLSCKKDELARLVKIADLTHNLRDLTKGSMKEKYELAKYILEN